MQRGLPQVIQARQQTPRFSAVFAVLKSVIVAASAIIAATVGPAALAGCSEHNNGTAADSTTLLVDIFSGRPNPVYALTNAETERIAKALASLREIPESTDEHAALGFRGFKVSSLALGGEHVTMTVVFDRVSVLGNAGNTGFVDTGQSMHELLLQLVRERDADIASAVEASG